MLDATLVAIAEHGLVPSVVASRMTLAAAPEALQGAVAAGILGCGSVILGAAESAAHLFADILLAVALRALDSKPRHVRRSPNCAMRAAPFPGTVTRCTRRDDPRATRLFALRRKAGLAGRYVEVAQCR